MKNKILYNYFFILFSIIPISLLVGSAASSINIVVISLSFLIYIFYLKEWKWLKNKNIKLLIFLYFYLIFNSFISLDFNISINRNFGFIIYIIFFVSFNYFFLKYKKFNRIFIVWSIVIALVVLDVYLEAFTGKSMTMYYLNESHIHNRVYSFFRDEPKVGGFIGCFFLILTGYFLNIYQLKSNKVKYFIIFISIIFILSILFTGERSNTIKALIAFFIFFMMSKGFSIRSKIISVSSVILIFVVVYSNFNFVKYRYGQLIFNELNTISDVINYVKKTNYKQSNIETQSLTPEEVENFNRALGSNYFTLYVSSLKVFINYPIFGVGNKNYRIVTCTKYASDNKGTIYYQFYKSNNSEKHELYNSHYICNTHPHQIYFEFLAEHGIFGTLILLFVFFKLIYQIFKEVNFNKDNLQLGSLVYILLVFFPLLPGGSFFNNYGATLFWINLSIMIASSKTSNIFK